MIKLGKLFINVDIHSKFWWLNRNLEVLFDAAQQGLLLFHLLVVERGQGRGMIDREVSELIDILDSVEACCSGVDGLLSVHHLVPSVAISYSFPVTIH